MDFEAKEGSKSLGLPFGPRTAEPQIDATPFTRYATHEESAQEH